MYNLIYVWLSAIKSNCDVGLLVDKGFAMSYIELVEKCLNKLIVGLHVRNMKTYGHGAIIAIVAMESSISCNSKMSLFGIFRLVLFSREMSEIR